MIVIVPCGGLGNLLFQHAAAWSFAKEQGQELGAIGWYPHPNIPEYPAYKKFGEFSDLFKHVKMVTEARGAEWSEPCFTYVPIPRDARVLNGYYQSWKYFDKYRIELRDLLRSNVPELWAEQKSRFSGGVCVHVRWGGDGRKLFAVNQTVLPKEYYLEAMKLFPNNKFLLFCEEPDLVADLTGPNVEVVHEPDPVKTLFLMSLCDHFIIANSTLSLSAYSMRENEDARLVAPRAWFAPGRGPAYDINDLIKPGPNVVLMS
jgi:Glycosyl transferase family 11